ncbi:MAG: S1C family serine protease [Gemmata sp.]
MITRLFATAVVVTLVGTPAFAQIGKDSKLLGPFKPIVARANESTVRIKCDDKDAILGTIVDPDGYILTKLSELRGTVYVRLPDGSEYQGTTVAAHKETDLALLKVDVKGLKAVKFADTTKVPQGNWLAAAGPTSDPISVGIVSVMTRKLTGRDTVITNPNRGYLGIFPADEKDTDGKLVGAKITELSPGGAAEKAGLKAEDVIVEMNGKPILGQTSLRDFLDTLRGGDVIEVKAKRKGEVRDFKVTLGSAPKDRGDVQNSMGTILSGRRTGFPQVLQTDLVVDAKECGGPVVDLEGNVLGINIARAGRVETWILPSEEIRPLLPQFKAGKFAPPSAVKLPVAPAPHKPKK